MDQEGHRGGRVAGMIMGRPRVVAGVFVVAAVGMLGLANRYAEESADALEAGASTVLEPLGAAQPDAPGTESAAGSDPVARPEIDPAFQPALETAPAPAPAAPADSAIAWASPREPSPVVPVPESQRVPKPAAVRGIYVGAWPMGSARRLPELIGLADATEVNAFVIDVKDVTGQVSYATEVPLARQLRAASRLKIGDIRGVLATLREHGVYPIARIVAFKDPLLAGARPDWAVRRDDGTLWEDEQGVHWVDSFNEDVWAYNIELAREAIALGFSEIQWDYIRFPDAPQSYMEQAVYPARDGRTMSQGIRAFMMRSREELAPTGAPLTADVFGITTSAHRDVGIGQLWEDMADVMDVLLPMVYPSHYPRGTWDFPAPNAAPYQIVRKAMHHGVERSRDIESAATIRPWLQAFSLGEPAYTPQYVRAQIDAVYDAGLTEWILWNPSARYSAEALVTADGRAPWFAGRGASLYEPPLPEIELEDSTGRGEPLGTPQDLR